MQARLQIQTVDGMSAEKHLDALAKLRMTVFRDFPYLYDGTIDYERTYLATYFRSPNARVVLCHDGQNLVGASTVIPMVEEDEAFQAPMRIHGINPAEVMYFGESILLPQYRGHGVGKRFFQERLAYAESFPIIKLAAFCAVVRTVVPKEYRPLDVLWQSYGFRPIHGLTCQLSWKQVDEQKESLKTLQFWMREL